jgi:hypothetical protein
MGWCGSYSLPALQECEALLASQEFDALQQMVGRVFFQNPPDPQCFEVWASS